MNAFGLVLAVGITLVSAAMTPLKAATLKAIEGQVFVSKGLGFKQISGAVALTRGDVVMARPGAKAEIAFADGCTVLLAAGAVVQVGEQSPCASTKPQGLFILTAATGHATPSGREERAARLPSDGQAMSVGGLAAATSDRSFAVSPTPGQTAGRQTVREGNRGLQDRGSIWSQARVLGP